ncbi:MAG TPA: tol-pal system protein YbgF [Magnetovibrio sp.]
MSVKRIRSSFAVATVATALVVGLPFAGPLFGSPQALAQDSQAVVERLNRLERDIRTLNQQIARGSAGATSVAPISTDAAPTQFNEGEGGMSRVLVRMGQLEMEVRNATGLSEGLSYRIDQLNERLDKLMVDLDYRLQRLEGSNPGSFSATPPVSAPPQTGPVSRLEDLPPVGQDNVAKGTVQKGGVYQAAPQSGNTLGSVSQSKLDSIVNQGEAPAAKPQTADSKVAAAPPSPEGGLPDGGLPDGGLPDGSAEDQYRFAFDLTRQARYDEAEIAFKAFLGAHDKDPLADNARYWLAETYYVRKRFMESAQAFFEAYQKAPKGNKAPDSLLKLGMSMAQLDKTAEACATFGKLRKEYSPLKANIEQALSREVKRLSCK